MTPDMRFIKRRVAVIWLSLVLLTALSIAILIVYSRNGYLERSRTSSQNLVGVLEQHIKSDLDVADALIRTTSRMYLYLKNHEKIPATAITMYLGNPNECLLEGHVEFVHIADADGNVVYGLAPSEHLNIAQREYFKEAKSCATASLIISKPLKGLRVPRWNIYLARRMNNLDGSFAGIVYAAYSLEHVKSLFASVVTDPGGSIVLRSSNLDFLIRSPEIPGSEADIGTKSNISRQLRAALENGEEAGTIELFSPADNTRRISSFLHVTPYPLVIIAGFAFGEILRPWYMELYCVCAGFLCIVVLTGLAARRIASDSAQQIHHQNEMRAKKQAEQLNALLMQDLETSLGELRQKDQILISQSRQAAMGEMISNIAHQWRQPLNVLSLLLTNLELTFHDNNLTVEYFDKTLASVGKLIQKMSSTIDDFRNFYREDKTKEPFSALKNITRTVELIESAFKNNGITISIEAGEDCIMFGFPNEYSQVLLNLLGNAKEAILGTGTASGHVSITCEKRDDMGIVTVRDNGGGIPADILGRVFEPYFTTKDQGTGIGLYMSKMIIENHMGGRIEARNLTDGCEFSISIPLEENRRGQ